jgi:hypothetical protein
MPTDTRIGSIAAAVDRWGYECLRRTTSGLFPRGGRHDISTLGFPEW